MTIDQYVLFGSTIRSYLSWMKDENIIEIIIENAALKWLAIKPRNQLPTDYTTEYKPNSDKKQQKLYLCTMTVVTSRWHSCIKLAVDV